VHAGVQPGLAGPGTRVAFAHRVLHSKVVARYRNGRLLKGSTSDFLPSKELFHLSLFHGLPGARTIEVRFTELKALCFVRETAGNPQRADAPPPQIAIGRSVRVVFDDGEVLTGRILGDQHDRLGFFVVPADPASNHERCFVVSSATREVLPI
jgi:hypothetical protein